MKQALLGLPFCDEHVEQTWIWPEGSAVQAASAAWLQGELFFLHLWGAPATGKSHLANMLTGALQHEGQRVAFVDAQQSVHFSQQLTGLEAFDWVVVDHLEAALGQLENERAFFHLFNALSAKSSHLLILSRASMQEMEFCVPDLGSRLRAMVSYPLHELTQEERLKALVLRAKWRGFEVQESTLRQLLKDSPGPMGEVIGQLSRLDEAALRQGRKRSLALWKEVADAPLD